MIFIPNANVQEGATVDYGGECTDTSQCMKGWCYSFMNESELSYHFQNNITTKGKCMFACGYLVDNGLVDTGDKRDRMCSDGSVIDKIFINLSWFLRILFFGVCTLFWLIPLVYLKIRSKSNPELSDSKVLKLITIVLILVYFPLQILFWTFINPTLELII